MIVWASVTSTTSPAVGAQDATPLKPLVCFFGKFFFVSKYVNKYLSRLL